jgi:hypothetical protein
VCSSHVSRVTSGFILDLGPMAGRSGTNRLMVGEGRTRMNNIFYIIGVVVVVLAVFGYLRLG